MKRRLAVGVGVAAVAVAAAVLTGRGRSSGPVTSTRVLMGTSWSIQAVPPADSSRQAARAAIRAAWAEVARVEAVMSEWQPESPVSAVNAAAGRPDAVEVLAELAALLQRAIELGRLTDGAFDVTWKGMGRLWDLGADDFAPPSQGEIDAARKRVDYRKLTVEGHRVRLPAAGMAVGLGGIAKGYGIDRAAAVLRRPGSPTSRSTAAATSGCPGAWTATPGGSGSATHGAQARC